MKSELVLMTTRKVGFLKYDVCFLSFFKDEMLITSLDNKKQKELFLAKKDDVKESGGGFIKQSMAMQKVIPEYADMIKNMDKTDIMKENTESIKKESITDIKFKRAKENNDYENNTSSISQGKLIILLTDKKIKFKHMYQDKNNDLKDYFKKYL
ncbi:MAG: hypothetical protein PHR55_02555 [Bacilli bacterium]|nr:hypothetical protein [Bacilli bacterium]